MLRLAPLLTEGAWQAPLDAPLSPPPDNGATFPPSFSFVWNIPHFLSLSCLSMYSPAFYINGHAWKIYIYPKGNNNGNRQLSVYLDSGITDSHEALHCNFKLAVVNYKLEQSARAGKPLNTMESVVKESTHAFCSAPAPLPQRILDRHARERVYCRAFMTRQCHLPCMSRAERAKDWGFREFMALSSLEDPTAGYLNGHSITLGVWLELS